MNIELRIIYYKASNQSWLYKFKDNAGNLITKDQDTVEYIQFLEAQLKSKDELLMEAYESIVINAYYEYICPEYGNAYIQCRHCEEEKGHKHSDNCIVKKAQDYISKES